MYCFTVFSSQELENAFRNVFDLVWSQDPESFPFRQPVDPKLLGIPVSLYCISFSCYLTVYMYMCALRVHTHLVYLLLGLL